MKARGQDQSSLCFLVFFVANQSWRRGKPHDKERWPRKTQKDTKSSSKTNSYSMNLTPLRCHCRIKAAAVVRLPASGCIDDKTNIACFAVFARRKNCSLSGRRRSFPTEPSIKRQLKNIPGLDGSMHGCRLCLSHTIQDVALGSNNHHVCTAERCLWHSIVSAQAG